MRTKCRDILKLRACIAGGSNLKNFIAILILLLGLLAVYEGTRLGYKVSLEESGVGLFPVLTGSCLILCSLYQLFLEPKAKKTSFSVARWTLVCGIFVGFVLYSVAMKFLGYTLSTFLFVLGTTKILGNRSWTKAFAIAATSAAVFLIVFKIWIQIPLPIGWIEEILGVF
jgi:putative tricarboxylic transport membrane protein